MFWCKEYMCEDSTTIYWTLPFDERRTSKQTEEEKEYSKTPFTYDFLYLTKQRQFLTDVKKNLLKRDRKWQVMNANEKRKNQVQVVFVEIIAKNNKIM